jgi:hypothetical protein
MFMAKGEKPILSVRVEQELLDALEKMAEKSGASRSELVERYVGHGLELDFAVMGLWKSRLTGPVLQVLTHPKVMKAILSLTGDEPDPALEKIRDSAIDERRGKKAKLASE